MVEKGPLPPIDEHSIGVKAGSKTTWAALERVVETSFGSAATARFARLLGCENVAVSGPRPLAAGSTLPGFHVEQADEPRLLALAGAHRFSAYALVFHLDAEDDERTVLRAETRAAFPGIKGRTYRFAVIGTRIHVLVTRRLLAAVKRRAEKRDSARPND